MTDFARSASLDGFAQISVELGLDAAALIAEVGLPAQCLTEPDLRIPTSRIFALFELAARRADVSDLGLRLAAQRDLATFGALGLVIREQANVREAIAMLARYIWAHVDGLSLEIEEIDGIAILAPQLRHPSGQAINQADELIAARIVRLLRRFLGARWNPEMVLLRHARPAKIAAHVALFGVAPLFAQERSAVVMLASDLDRAIPDANPHAASELIRYLEFVSGTREASISERVATIIALLLPRGSCRVDMVARQFGVDRRTLHRQLAREGNDFSTLLHNERVMIARATLADQQRSYTEIAAMLGFSSLSAFSRWKRTALADQPRSV